MSLVKKDQDQARAFPKQYWVFQFCCDKYVLVLIRKKNQQRDDKILGHQRSSMQEISGHFYRQCEPTEAQCSTKGRVLLIIEEGINHNTEEINLCCICVKLTKLYQRKNPQEEYECLKWTLSQQKVTQSEEKCFRINKMKSNIGLLPSDLGQQYSITLLMQLENNY